MNTSLRFSLPLMALIAILGCDEQEPEGTGYVLQPDATLDALTVHMDGVQGALTAGRVPFDANAVLPTLISGPDLVRSKRLASERLELVYETDTPIEEVYVGVAKASRHYTFLRQVSSQSSASESVAVTVNLPQTLPDGDFCTEVSVRDTNQRVSSLNEVCFSIAESHTANRVIYFADYSARSTLSTLNFDTGEVVEIGPVGYRLTDIAFSGGELYGVTFSQLLKLDLQTGAGTVVGAMGYGTVNALVGDDDRLFAGTTAGQFLSLDRDTGLGTELGQFGSGASSSGDFVFDKDGRYIFASLNVPGSRTDQLAVIDPEDGTTTFVGETGFNRVYGLAFFRNQLMGLTDYGDLLVIDPGTGRGARVNDTQVFSAGGAATLR